MPKQWRFHEAHQSFSSSTYPHVGSFAPAIDCDRLSSPRERRFSSGSLYEQDFVRLIVENMAEAVDEPNNRRFLWIDIAD